MQLWTSSSPQDKDSSAAKHDKLFYEELILGVWRVVLVKDSLLSTFNFRWGGFSAAFGLMRRALDDVYTICPRLFILTIVARVWFAIEGPLSLYLSNRLFLCIEKRISGNTVDDQIAFDLYFAIISGIACSILHSYIKWASQQVQNTYASRIKYEFQARVFTAMLACDLQTAQEHQGSVVDIDEVYCCLEDGIDILKELVSFLLHLHLIMSVIGSGIDDGGPVFVAICLLPSLMGQFDSDYLWSKAYFISPWNKFFVRKATLERLADADLREEIMAGGVSSYLVDEYRKAKDGLGDIPDIGADLLYSQQRRVLLDFIMKLCSDGPTLYFAFLALFNPSKLSIVQFALLTQTSSSLHSTFFLIKLSFERWPAKFSRMATVYSVLDAKNRMKDGTTPFPRPGHESSAGMSIQVQDVSFSYPNTTSERAALDGVSFTIQPGQLVVIVGTNGSGKSTIIKLLSRFYDATSGKILIDGIPIEEYKVDELRKGIAMLTQEHELLPLSIRENIQLGSFDADGMKDEGKIAASISAAGAEGVVKNFLDGRDTILGRVYEATGHVSYAGRGNKELETMQKEWDKSQANVSGGEKQRLVAARAFMRLFTSPLKLVVVDEPSSALDPEAEYKLFTNLRKERDGRTMIFVTHRFGHLTKHADLIICIKEGVVVETGTHTDLLSKSGEYAHLYNIQAQAFAAA